MTAWHDIEPRHGELRTLRAREERAWRDLARNLRPDGKALNPNEQRNRDDGDDPFDSAPLYALDDFVGGSFTKATNPAERWFEYGLGKENPLMQFKPVAQWLRAYTNLVYESLDPARDNFYLNAPAWFADMGCFGTGFMWQEEVVGGGAFTAFNIPVGQSFKDVDANGITDTYHREFMLTGRQAKRKWMNSAAVSAFRDDEQIQFVHALYANPEFKPGNPFARYMAYRSCYVSPDKRDFVIESGYNEFPLHEIEWNLRSGRAWCTGPGHNALPDIRSADETARAIMVAMAFDAEPMWWAADEDVMTRADMVPGNVLYGDPVRDKPPAQILERAKQMQLPLQLRESLRNDIRKAFNFGLSQVLAGRPQMTAEEVMAYKADELKALAPHLIRIHRGLAGVINRRARLLDRMGLVLARIGPPPPELANERVSVQFVSPFAKAQQADVAKGAMGWVNTKVQLAEQTQNPEWTDDIDIDGFSALTHDAMSGVPSIRRDPREVAQIRQNRVMAQQQQAQLENAANAASVYADVAHADQASTLAKRRAAK
jgi:hypothetical protein